MERHLPFVLALALALPATARAEQTTWNIDPAHTQSAFAVRHLVIATVRGEFTSTKGFVMLDEKDPTKSSVGVTIDTRSIHTRDDKRDEHLRAADFFDAQNHPTITFASTRVERVGEGRYKVMGDLTMRGTTKPVVLDATLTDPIKDVRGNARRGVQATTKLNRREFGLNYGKMIEAGPVVGDEVTVEINAEIVKATAEQKAALSGAAQPKAAAE
jgi:polyisoprenoid-binding protein YceI